MVFTAVLCTDIPEFQQNRVLDPQFAQQFPGTPIYPLLAGLLSQHGWELITGDVAIADVDAGIRDAKTLFVIQEETSLFGQQLIEKGSHPAVLLCGESPLYARDFYESLEQISEPFPHRILFSGAHTHSLHGANHTLYFPSFHKNHVHKQEPWKSRAFLAMMAGNKYYRHAAIPWPERILRSFREISHPGTYRWLRENQLHDTRLELVSYFSSVGRIDIYGQGWGNRQHLPKRWQRQLEALKMSDPSIPYSGKAGTLSKYKFALTLENFRYPGYVTEKIIDALVAGTIPVYLGAPDIMNFVPAGAFVNLEDFTSPQSLESFLDQVSPNQAEEMLLAGREFLSSTTGELFSIESRAELLAELLLDVAKGN